MRVILILFLIFLVCDSQYVCPVHIESIKNGLDASVKYSGFVAMENNCKSCYVETISNEHVLQYGCYRNRHRNFGYRDTAPTICDNVKEGEYICTSGSCCCRDYDCFDKIRNELATKKAVTGVACNVTILDDELEDDFRILRTICGACMATKKENGIESVCVEDADVSAQCSNKTNFKGENLACNAEGTSCCCVASDCQRQFKAHFYGSYELKSASIRSPYRTQTAISTTFSSSIILICFLFA